MEAETVVVLPPKPVFKALNPQEIPDEGGVKFHKVPVPPHRVKPLKRDWEEIYNLVYDQMKVDIRMNTKARQVELKTRPDTPEIGDLQKCADFIHAFMLGFERKDAKALLHKDSHFGALFSHQDCEEMSLPSDTGVSG
ncbi:hypothetical protein ACS0TY_015769 [Phlomoides rotata]